MEFGALYWPLVFVHVLAFAYWLGADFGVFVTGGYVARADLPLAERLRFLEALMRIDILPRLGIVLLPTVGLQIASLRGAITLPAWAQTTVWLVGGAWALLVWLVFRRRGTPLGDRLQLVDVRFRVVLIVVLLAVGFWSLFGAGPVTERWLATKLLTYAALLAVGLYLRTVIRAWRTGFQALATGPDAAAEHLIAEGIQRGRRGALVFWALIALTAYLGIAKPY